MARIRMTARAIAIPAAGEKSYFETGAELEVAQEEADRLVGHGVAEVLPADPPSPTRRGKGAAAQDASETAAAGPGDPPADPSPAAEKPKGSYRRSDMKAEGE